MHVENGQVVTLVRYEPGPNNKPGKAVEYPAIVIGAERIANAETPNLHLAFLHPARAGVLNGANWRDSFDRQFSVPHEDAIDKQAFYYRLPEDPDEVDADLLKTIEQQRTVLENQSDTIAGLEMQVKALQVKYENTTEGKDEKLQATADAGNRKVPSAADLDAVAADEKAKEDTTPKASS